jgi:hypothetical protein
MQWNDIAILVGACATVAGGIAFLRYMPAAFRESRLRPTTHLTTTVRLESVGQLLAGVLMWGGGVLAQVGVVANDLQRGASHQSLAFTLASAAVLILVCGVTLGRLTLRRQLNLEPAMDSPAGGAGGPA